MMTNEFRLRPVTRFVLTHYQADDDAGSASTRTVGEFPNVQSAEEVGVALQALVPGSTLTTIDGRQAEYPPKALAAAMAVRAEPAVLEYVIVERSFDVMAQAYYAETLELAEQHKARFEKMTAKEYRIFERVVTDPVKLALRAACL